MPDDTPDPLRPFECYYEISTGYYLVTNRENDWIPQTESQIKRRLKAAGVGRVNSDQTGLTQVDMALLHLQNTWSVAYAGPVAGYSRGLHIENNKKILITTEAHFITPWPGKWPKLYELIKGLLVYESIDQRPYLFAWLKLAYNALITGQRQPGQCLVIAGPSGCGKSLLQKLITMILGGRSANPYPYMMSDKPGDFNSELFESEHLPIEDQAASNSTTIRRKFGQKIKELTVNDSQTCHAKYGERLCLRPIWRLSISLNDEPENLMILPPIDESIADKIILMRGYKAPMPMPTQTASQEAAFWLTLNEELPAFIHFLVNEFTIPDEMRADRYGMKEYHHPDVIAAINELQPETKLLALIDLAILSDSQPRWEGTSEMLEREFSESVHYQKQAHDLFTEFPRACGTYLDRLRKKRPDRVRKIRTTPRNVWEITKSHILPSSETVA